MAVTSAGVAVFDAGHYEISATNECAKCRVAYPCPPVTAARRTDIKRMKANRGTRA